jgi:hypothetical protein
MKARLYAIPASHPAFATRLMLSEGIGLAVGPWRFGVE